MHLFMMLLIICVAGSNVAKGCHTKVVTRTLNGPRSKREIHVNDTDELVNFFTGCMNKSTVNDTFDKWESVVSFAIKDTNWFADSDSIYCNDSKDLHTAACWQYNMDYLIKTTSVLYEPSKLCVAQYDVRGHATKDESMAGRKKRDVNDFSMSVLDDKDAALPSPTVNTKRVTRRCNMRNTAFHKCLEESTDESNDLSASRSFSFSREEKERTFDKDVLKFIAEHLSDCRASRSQRMNQLQVCSGTNVSKRGLDITEDHHSINNTCVSYSSVMKIVRDKSPLAAKARKCRNTGNLMRCLPPKSLKHSKITNCTTTSFDVNTTCTVTCDEGYKLDNPDFSKTTCLKFKGHRYIWMPSRIKCRKV